MNRVFGKKKAPGPPPPTLHEASESMDKRVDHLDVKIAQLEKELKGYRDKMKTTKSPAAKKNLQKRAMDVLKRKRMYEQQRDQICNQQFNLDQAKHGIESAKASVTAVGALKQANTELKKVIKEDLDIDEVEDLTDDMADLMDDFNEINEALGRNFATPDDIDEEDLEAELEMLGDELEEEEELESDAVPSYLQEPSLPAQPTSTPGSKVPENGSQVDEYGLPMAHNS
uniref:Charged multivesicular body protein 5 n=2 Tax=Helicotheca tamesis TaxID=374047 RepID=A0A7S2HYY0_9STRA|mmetsp:Transcript_3931/g.5299  ORF Transcript_3931/g.5299 Transcript_3931/m.5299 type:complete len:228 (+) Transcript_3931:55-738(+)|eukprot:CAMPEP_0185734682 /NCGR_PEP_ID=MMETSP1171-20130828/23172_1 /TAXON_ID=374046 /ORGANISM="Helicotheca tamensis, Strain CCMP826" /LENGTH=227 /DNA_ID=CAMNT_0028404743 /DNA_START=37 /DNA_END=720 /DNA_ORIENTATION=+